MIYETLQVSGNVQLSGTLTVTIFNENEFDGEIEILIIEANGTVNGSFLKVEVNSSRNDCRSYNASVIVQRHKVSLLIESNDKGCSDSQRNTRIILGVTCSVIGLAMLAILIMVTLLKMKVINKSSRFFYSEDGRKDELFQAFKTDL